MLCVLKKSFPPCALEAYFTLGPGLLENVFEEALVHEFALRKISYVRQKEINSI
ncbi:MAG: hypothetical protein HY882_13310 [Deltaproteobacteria bacterium]|nr:hypothetical protein [Deltaproteobacteria bacterium]